MLRHWLTLDRDFNHIRRSALRWFDKNQRDLPWRRTKDPYAIWVAETMLQQTQVSTVLPYYLRFMRTVSTIASLDRAPMEKILALWSGLGYYRRARQLKKAARTLMEEHRGKIPRDFASLGALPGIGPYTAGAIMSIAFNRRYPALDGNARRVLSRVFSLSSERELREAATRLVSPSRPGHFNQALMEIGAILCLPQHPRCPRCPIARFCDALKFDRFQPKAPLRAKRKIQRVEWPLVVLQRERKILLRQRPAGGLLGGLWEIPGGERKKRETLKSALLRHLNGSGEQMEHCSRIGEIRHAITHRKIRAPIFFSSCSKKNGRDPLPYRKWRWVSISALCRYPLSSLTLKAVRMVAKQ